MVVDAPTDWSLAGPLWELALDEAPVDEILDILIRRGIRTSPSFAIVRVEGEAVRALVRGNVPVCFERAGEPVRLDATGATTWLEGLISGARRVLVGAVDGDDADMPYLVSTGVVLVSGLALPCAPVGALTTDTGSTALADVEQTAEPVAPEPVVVAEPVPVAAVAPVAAPEPVAVPGPVAVPEPVAQPVAEPEIVLPEPEYAPEPVAVASGSLPVLGSEPRVVDLSRSGARNPAYAAPEARSFSPGVEPALPEQRGLAGLNGHVPAVLEPEPESGLAPYDRGVRSDRPLSWSPSGTGTPGFPADDSDGPVDDAPAAFHEDGLPGDESPWAAQAPASDDESADEVIDLHDAEAADAERARHDERPEDRAATSLAAPQVDDRFPAPVDDRNDDRFATRVDDGADGQFPGQVDDRADGRLLGHVDDGDGGQFPGRVDDRNGDRLQGQVDDRDADQFAGQVDDRADDRLEGHVDDRDADRFPGRVDDRADDRFAGQDDDQADDHEDRFDDLVESPAEAAPANDEPDRSDSPVFGRSDFAASTFPAADYRAPQELEEPESPFARRPEPASPFPPHSLSPFPERPTEQPERPAAPVARPEPVDSFDDLLIDPADGERPKGPSPADLPNFDPPSVSLPLPSALNGGQGLNGLNGQGLNGGNGANGNGVNGNGTNGSHQPGSYGYQPEMPSSPRAFGAPAAWPPAPSARPGQDEDDAVLSGRPSSFFRQADAEEAATPANEVDDPWAPPSRSSEPVPPRQGYRSPDIEDDAAEAPADRDPDALPFRVRGQSLRPEQRSGTMAGLNGSRLLGPSDPGSPFNPSPPAGLNGHGANGTSGSDSGAVEAPGAPAPAPSGGLLLPAFFRGARAARKSGPEAPAAPSAREGGPAEQPWPGTNGQSPAAWVPPVRRGQPGAPNANGSEAAMPPAMPGALRGSGDEGKAPATGGGGGGSEHREPPRLLGVWCDAGHVTSPDRDECRVCGLKVPSQAPILVARPPLGVLIFDNGDRVEVDRPIVLGRDPKPVSSPDPESPVLHAVPSATGQVSRTHAEVRASGWDVVLTDLDAMNGTALTLPGESPVAIEPGVPTVIVPGSRVDLGGESGFVFEIDG